MNTFYDIHLHAMDLSHPNLSAFLFREDLIDKLIDDHVKGKTRLLTVAASLFLSKNRLKKEIKDLLNKETPERPSLKSRIGNCLSMFEIPMEYQFLITDYFLRTGSPELFPGGRNLQIGGEAFDKMVICPLVMDFGYKNIGGGSFYNLAPSHPIAKQVGDLLYAIRTYYRFHLEVDASTKKMSLSPEIADFEQHKNEKLFEIYPFMGLDTRNYNLDYLRGTPEKQGLLPKYFSNFSTTETGQHRRQRLFEKMGKLDNNMHSKNIDYNDVFAGIKVYPQLGFDPWPQAPEELEKVQYLYQFCCDRRIPVTTHCSDGGYKVGDFDSLTNPSLKWAQVLKEFPTLSLNFAHLGNESKSDARTWRKTIMNLVVKYPNVYTDISCNDSSPAYYQELHRDLQEAHEEFRRKVLFGSDFSINLLVTPNNSYNQYLKAFSSTPLEAKKALCTTNPQSFLWGHF